MLVLSRTTGQSVQIGPDVLVTFLGVDPDGRVRLGVKAPRQVPIYRQELLAAPRPCAEPSPLLHHKEDYDG